MAFIQTPIFRPGQNVTFKQKVDSEVEYKGTVQSSKRDMDFFTYYVKLYAKKELVPASPRTYAEPF